MFHLFTVLIALYLIWRFIWPLPWHKTTKICFSALLLLVAENYLITGTFFGTRASPEIAPTLLMIIGWAFGAFVILALLVLLLDILGVLSYPVSRKLSQTLLKNVRVRYSLGIIALVLAAIGVSESVRVPDVKTVEIVLPRLPAELDGLRVVQLTDLHASRLFEAPWMEAVVTKANALNPDLILITGDLVDGTPAARAADVLPLKKLHARYGVFSIPGNHEYYSDYLKWQTAFDQLGLRFLLNEHIVLSHNNRNLVIAGITDSTAASFNLPGPDITAALKGIPENTSVILLSHRPAGAQKNAEAGVDLQLSGHTHGGQILGPHLLTQWVNEGFVSGGYQVDTMKLYVSNGTGLWNGFPIRLGRPSEITQLILRSPSA